ncbi:MAG: CvpA family protein [Firmicutes bacterium]|nr:CvpA family protein [Bacillota bacterium]
MFINVFDAIIVLFLLSGAIIGFKRGAIQTIAYIVGTILVIYFAWILKNPLAKIMYTYLPAFKLKGVFKGIFAFNILIYKGIAFVILLAIFTALLGIILKITGIISKLVDHSIILTLPSKLIGTVLGFLEAYIFAFILLFIFSQFSFSHEYLKDSYFSKTILKNTPMTTEFKNSYLAFDKISSIGKNDKSIKTKNNDSIEILKKYDIISENDINNLIKHGKIK